MKRTYMLMNSGLLVAALAVAPGFAQSTSSQTPSRPQSGQAADQGSDKGGDQKQRPKDKYSSTGEKVGEDTPSAGTDTDQRGTTAARGADSKAPGALSAVDRTFMIDAMEGNRAEVALAELAQKKATHESVRELAAMIQRHHEQANDKLKSIAADIDAGTNPTDLKPEHKQAEEKLSRLDERAFDAAYASEMVKEHQKDIAKYEKAAGQLQQAQLKAYARETLPHLKEHLEKARAAQRATSSSKSY